jgi:hypothetical protein
LNPTIKTLVAGRILEQVREDPETANTWTSQAVLHLEGARRIADLDPAGAHTLAYDAARKAASAALLTLGYRARAVPGSHAGVAKAIESMARSTDEARALARLDQLRRDRNRSEYGVRVFGGREVDAAISAAEQITRIISGWQ